MAARKHRIRFEALVDGEDAYHQPTQVWTLIDVLTAEIKGTRGTQAIHADAAVSINDVSIRIRKRDDMLPGMRGICGGLTYKVRAVLPDYQGGAWTDLVCEVVR